MSYTENLKNYRKEYGRPNYTFYAGTGDRLRKIIKEHDINIDKNIFLLILNRNSGPGKDKEEKIFPSKKAIEKLAGETDTICYKAGKPDNGMWLFFKRKEQWETFLCTVLERVCFNAGGENILKMDDGYWISVLRCMKGMDCAYRILEKRLENGDRELDFKITQFIKSVKLILEDRGSKTYLTGKEKFKWFRESMDIAEEIVDKELKNKYPSLSKFELFRKSIPGVFKALDNYYRELPIPEIKWEKYLTWWVRQSVNAETLKDKER